METKMRKGKGKGECTAKNASKPTCKVDQMCWTQLNPPKKVNLTQLKNTESNFYIIL